MTEATYQGFFDKVDAVIAELESEDPDFRDGHTAKDAADLLKRAGFYLANHLNSHLATHTFLALPPEVPAGEVVEPDGTDGASEGELAAADELSAQTGEDQKPPNEHAG